MSHGPLARGMYETTQWFMGEDIEQYGYLCLEPSENPEDFAARIREKIAEVDSGEGVILIADLKGGSPCNSAMTLLAQNEGVELLSGMNLALVLELLGRRLSDDYDMPSLIEAGRDGVADIRALLTAYDDEDE